MIKTVDEIYAGMMRDFSVRTGFDMLDSCELAVRLYTAAAQVAALYAQLEWVKRQCFPQTAAGDSLDLHAGLRGLTRRGATKAAGTLRFYIAAAKSVATEVPSGTVCMTAGAVCFETTGTVWIPAGSLYADAPAEAQAAGAQANASADSVTLFSNAPVGLVSCTNPSAFSGGSDGEDDETLRTRVLATFERLPNGGNAAFYESEALAVTGVGAASVVPRPRGTGTVDVVISSDAGMPPESLVEAVRARLEEAREIAVELEVMAPEELEIKIAAGLTVRAGYAYNDVALAVTAALEEHYDGSRLARDVLMAELGSIIYGVKGVLNYTLTEPAGDISVGQYELPVLSSVVLTEVR